MAHGPGGGGFGGATGACLDNNVALQGKDLGLVCQDLIKMDSAGLVHVGGASGMRLGLGLMLGGTAIDPGTGNVIFGPANGTSPVLAMAYSNGQYNLIATSNAGGGTTTWGNSSFITTYKGLSVALVAAAANNITFSPGNALAGTWYASGCLVVGAGADSAKAGDVVIGDNTTTTTLWGRIGGANRALLSFTQASGNTILGNGSFDCVLLNNAGTTIQTGANNIARLTVGLGVFGAGDATATPGGFVFRGANGTLANAGGDFTVGPGISVTGNGGVLHLQYAPNGGGALQDGIAINGTPEIVLGAGDLQAAAATITVRGTKKSGANLAATPGFQFQSPYGTGTGLGGYIGFGGSVPVGAGSGQHTFTECLRIYSSGLSLVGSAGGAGSPAAAALIDMTSTTQGYLPSRMTLAQANAIANKVTALTVFITDGRKTGEGAAAGTGVLCNYSAAGPAGAGYYAVGLNNVLITN